MALPLPRAAALLLLLVAPLLCAAQGPISQPPSPTASPHINPDSTPADDEGGNSIPPSVAPAPAPADDGEKAASPPAPIETAPAEAPAPLHSTAATPSPAPAAEDEGYKKKKKGKAPAPAPAAMEVKSSDGDERAQALDNAAENERREGMSGGKKAGVVIGVFSAVAVVGLAAVVYRKRQANIRRSRYADYSARLELV
jgi:cytoskeletal protein RodZ